MVFMARDLVQRFHLAEKAKIDFEHQMSEEEAQQYKWNKAVVNFKMLGMLVALPGIILVLIIFR
jgi:uncharacterized protein (DUF1919 family)